MLFRTQHILFSCASSHGFPFAFWMLKCDYIPCIEILHLYHLHLHFLLLPLHLLPPEQPGHDLHL